MTIIKKGRVIEGLRIEDIAYGGEGIAKISTDSGDFVFFVANSLPGQVVTAKIIKKKKRYAKAKLVRVEQPAPEELTLDYQPIPGAPFARFPIELQEEYKHRGTLEMFKRLSGIEHLETLFDTYISSPSVWHYRNKMEYSFSTVESALGTGEESEGFALGFKRRGQWWAVENLNADSGLFDATLEANIHRIRAFCEASGLPAWNPAKSEGFSRFLVVRKSYIDDQILMDLVTTSTNVEQFDRDGFVVLLKEILGERLAGVWHTLNDEVGDTSKQPSATTTLLYGQERIRERILGLDFSISMQSFFQTNPKCAELLYSKALEYVEEAIQGNPKHPVAMDLFCGTGTIAQLLTRCEGIQEIIGVDIVPEAIRDANKNAADNQIDNIKFYAADVRKFLREYPQYQDKIGVVILDPPRGGIVPKALKRTIELNAPCIVYISCNPSTQARDTVELVNAGYELKKFCLVDQFPHTSHIESVALFEKK